MLDEIRGIGRCITIHWSRRGGRPPYRGQSCALAAPRLSSGVSNCLKSQALTASGTRHDSCDRTMLLRMVSSFRMQAVSASFFGFPAASSRR